MLLASRDSAYISAVPVIALLVLRRTRLAPVIAGLALGAVVMAIHLHALSRAELHALIGKDVEVSGIVSSDSSLTRPRVIGSNLMSAQTTFIMRAEKVKYRRSTFDMRIPIRVISSEKLALIPGDRVSIYGKVKSTRELRLAAVLHTRTKIKIIESQNSIFSALESIRNSVRELSAGIGSESAALLPGMALGDTSLQSQSMTDAMRHAGLSHLTAVSGANFAIVSAFIFLVIGWITRRRNLQIVFTAIFLVLFIFLVRPTPSVLRAAVMAGVFLVSRASGERRSAINALAFAITILLLVNPFQAFDPGFILSVSATSGLILLAPRLQTKISTWLPNWLAEILAIAISATAFCTPYLIFLAGSLNLLTVIANAVVAPVVPPITVLTLIATLALPISANISAFLLRIADLGAAWILTVARLANQGPSVNAPLLVLIVVSIYLAWRARSNLVLISLLFLTILTLTVHIRSSFPGTNWQIGQCDVGQGDALLVNLGSGNAALFDAGPDPELLLNCLARFGIRRLPLAVISHRHADHYQGLFSSKGIAVDEIWTNQPDFLTDQFPNVLVKKSGDSAQVAGLQLEVLWPLLGKYESSVLAGDGSIENNQSLVILAKISGVEILITGDIEPDAQHEISRKFQLEGVDVLKVPHHGSKYQDSGLFDEIKASIYLISVGANSYGHPDAKLVERLSQGSGKVFRTDKNGAVSLGWQVPKGANRPIFSPRMLRKDWWRIRWN